MRTILDTLVDVLKAVKERVRRQKRNAGVRGPKSFYGFDPLPPRGEPVTNELIDKLREQDLRLD